MRDYLAVEGSRAIATSFPMFDSNSLYRDVKDSIEGLLKDCPDFALLLSANAGTAKRDGFSAHELKLSRGRRKARS